MKFFAIFIKVGTKNDEIDTKLQVATLKWSLQTSREKHKFFQKFVEFLRSDRYRVRKNCRSQKILQLHLVANTGLDTAENKPSEAS